MSRNRRALDLTPQPSSWIQANLGLALRWDGQPAEAQRVFETVIKTDTDYLRAYIGLAVALYRQGRVNEAKKVYRELVVMDPGYQPEGWIAQNLNFNPKDSEQFMSDLLAASRQIGVPQRGPNRWNALATLRNYLPPSRSSAMASRLAV